MSLDPEALNAQARLEWEIVVTGLSDLISNTGVLNTTLGYTDKTVENLEKTLVKLSTGLEGVAESEAVAGSAAEDLAAKQDAAANAFGRASVTISGQRHALAAAAGDLAAFGAALIAIPIATAVIASDYQRDFANVERATLLPTVAADELKNSLIQLTEQVPESFKAITQIATAGAQLGIPDSGLVQFTEVVAKLTATTQISAVAAENLFQKFYVLAGVKPDNFENLASAILNVSIHTGAAEAQVSLLATRIIGVAQQAGFTVPQVIALSAAFGSISAQSASYQMGTVVRLVGNLQAAAEGAGPALDAFAKTAGLTDQAVQKAFGTPQFAGYFLDFVTGLDKSKKAGGDVLSVLDDMGIKSIRDRAAILNLADAHVTLAKALKLADEGYANSSLLNLHFQKVNETLKSQTTEMINTFGALGNELGAISTGPLTDMVDGVINATKAFADFEQTGFGQGATTVVLGASLILGSLVLVASAITKVGDSLLTLKDATTAPITFINGQYVKMTAATEAAAAAAADDAEWNERAAATLGELGLSADEAAAQFTALAAAEDSAGGSGAAALGTGGKLAALLGGTTAGGLLSAIAPIAAGGVAFVAAANFMEQLAQTTVVQEGLTASAQAYGDQLKQNEVSVHDYIQVLGDLNSNPNGRQDPFIRSGSGKVLQGYDTANISVGKVDAANLDTALSTAPADNLITEYAKLVQAGKEVGFSAEDIAQKFPKATAAYNDAIKANLGLASAAKQNAEGIRNTATAVLQLDDDLGGAKAVATLEATIEKSTASLSGMKSALTDLTNPTKAVTESLDSVTKQLNANTQTAKTWATNLRIVTLQYGNDVANQFISAGADATTESLLAQLVKATPAQGAAYKKALLANLNATNSAIAQQQLEAADIVSHDGSPIGAAEALAISNELKDGIDFRTIAEKWGIELAKTPLEATVKVYGDFDSAAAAANYFFKQFANSANTANHWIGNSVITIPSISAQHGGSFDQGGPTGPGADSDVKGVVHANEFVFSAPATRAIGVENLAFAHNMAKSGAKGYQDGGFVGSGGVFGGFDVIAHLSAEDRKILIDGFAQQVYAYFADSDVALAQHANAGNKALGVRGRN